MLDRQYKEEEGGQGRKGNQQKKGKQRGVWIQARQVCPTWKRTVAWILGKMELV
jgi:hypothetical protein